MPMGTLPTNGIGLTWPLVKGGLSLDTGSTGRYPSKTIAVLCCGICRDGAGLLLQDHTVFGNLPGNGVDEVFPLVSEPARKKPWLRH